MSRRNKSLELLSFVWMVGIVLFHSGNGAPLWYGAILSDFRIGGVSYFFIVSGYFFVRHYDERPLIQWWSGELAKRFRSLAIPYFLWCLLGLSGFDFLRQFGIASLGPTANPPLWYIKFLFLFCLAAPIFAPVIKRMSKSRFFLPGFAVAGLILPWIPLPMKFCLVVSLWMFLFGVGLSFCGHSTTFCNWLLPISIVVWVLLYCLKLTQYANVSAVDWPLRVYSAVALMVTAYLAVRRIGELRSLPSFVSMSFFVYCSHALLLRHLHLPLPSGTVGCFLKGCAAVALALTIGCFLRHFAGSVYSLLCGKR